MGKCLLSVWLWTLSTLTFAQCECTWQGPFSWLVDDADYIVLGEVVASRGNSFDLKPMRELKGSQYLDTIRIWGRRGDLCRPDVADFPVGSQWVFALQAITELPAGGFNPGTPDISFGRVGDYAVSKCGAYWLQHHNGTLSGNITSVYQWDYAPKMNPVPVDLLQAFIDGTANYADIIGVSEEITSKEAWMRHMRERMQQGN
jgi:hypothetical protein